MPDDWLGRNVCRQSVLDVAVMRVIGRWVGAGASREQLPGWLQDWTVRAEQGGIRSLQAFFLCLRRCGV